MVTQALVFAASGLGEDGCDKQSGGSSYTGPRRAPLPTDQPGGGDVKRNKKRGDRPGFMTPFPTMKSVPLGIEDMFISSGDTK